MVICKLCGASGFLLRVDGLGLCDECEGIFATELRQRTRTIEEARRALSAPVDQETALELWALIRQNAQELYVYEKIDLPIKPVPSRLLSEASEAVDTLHVQMVSERVERILARAEQADSNRAKSRDACKAISRIEQARQAIEGDKTPLDELESRVRQFCNRVQFIPFLEAAERAEAKDRRRKALALYRDAEYYLMKHPIDAATDAELIAHLERKIQELEGVTTESLSVPSEFPRINLSMEKRPIALSLKRRIKPEALIQLYQYSWWAKDRLPSDIKIMLENSTLVFSLWDENALVGFARVLSDKVYRATIWDMMVHPQYRGFGLGSRIMEAIFAHPELAKVEIFFVTTPVDQEFYAKFGFQSSEQGMVLTRAPKLDLCSRRDPTGG